MESSQISEKEQRQGRRIYEQTNGRSKECKNSSEKNNQRKEEPQRQVYELNQETSESGKKADEHKGGPSEGRNKRETDCEKVKGDPELRSPFGEKGQGNHGESSWNGFPARVKLSSMQAEQPQPPPKCLRITQGVLENIEKKEEEEIKLSVEASAAAPKSEIESSL